MSTNDLPVNAPGFNPFAALIGFKYTECAEGRCSCTLEVRDELFHPGGLVHGGVAFTLADSTMALALISVLDEGQTASTIEVKISYLEAVRSGTLAATSTIIRRGRSVVFMESIVTEGDRVVAKATGTFAIINLNR